MKFEKSLNPFAAIIPVLAPLVAHAAMSDARNTRYIKPTTPNAKSFQTSPVEGHSEYRDIDQNPKTTAIDPLNMNKNITARISTNALPLCDGVYIEVEVLTDFYPNETSWTLVDNCGMGIVEGQEYYGSALTAYADSYCLPELPYTFTIYDSFGDGLCCGGAYTVRYDGIEAVSGGEFDYNETMLINGNRDCPTNAPSTSAVPSVIPSVSVAPSVSLGPSVSAAPSVGPSVSLAPSSSVGPSLAPSQAPTSCDGVFIEVELLTDWYPNETSWTLVDNCGMGIVEGRDYYGSALSAYADSYCLHELPYTFTIYDSFGDGLCCGGAYTVRYDGIEAVSGGEFDYNETMLMKGNRDCPTNTPSISAFPSVIPSVSVAPSVSLGPSVSAAPSVGPSVSLAPSSSVGPSLAPSQAPTTCDGVFIEVELLTDWYPNETSWTLVDNCGMGIVEGQDYYGSALTAYADSYCLPELPYTFTIYDSFGDGLCCGGAYTVRYDGIEAASGGDFNYSDTKLIEVNEACPPNASSVSAAPSAVPSLFPSAAPIVSTPRVKKVKVVSGTGAPIQVFEVLVFSSGKNVALGKIATQSSNYKNLSKFGAEKAVDGSMSSFSHTQRSMNGSWWEVDLGAVVPIESISILNRWCISNDDPSNCLCRLSYSMLYLWDNKGELVAAEVIGNTCGTKEVNFTFPSLSNCYMI